MSAKTWAFLLALSVVLCLAAISILGQNASAKFNTVHGGIAYESKPASKSPVAKSHEASESDPSVATNYDLTVGVDKMPALARPVPAPPRAAADEAMVGAARSRRDPRESRLPQSGQLTAGSFDDNTDPRAYQSFARRISQHPDVAGLPGKFITRRLMVIVKDSADQPLGNATVRIEWPGGASQELTTHSDGRVIFLSGWDRLAEGELSVRVTPQGGGPGVVQTVPATADRWEVTVPGVKSSTPVNLDLAIVLDTTGSMGDELRFLQSEIKSISTIVRGKFPHVDQKYGLVLYRDEGDEYVTRSFDFDSSIDEFHRHLLAQSAAGGGDEPEALHKAMEAARQLHWRDGQTARVLFLITDAPPHTQYLQRTFDAIDVLRKRGVAIYPVACSDSNVAAEFVLRSCALMTGSRYLFLTNDSGVGNAHAEPHIPYYQVQRLEKLMVRMIASELSGKRIEPEPRDVLRTVGRPVN